VNVHLLVDTKHNLNIVPTAAIQRGPQGTYVYVVDSTNTVKIQPVKIAQTTDTSVGINDGINAGDVVVIDGADKLQDGSKVTPTAGNAKSGANANNSNNPPPNAPPEQNPAAKGKKR
jgi:membrane fusion protein, multidrug efflux system